MNTVSLSAFGYEAEILPRRGANLIRFAKPALRAEALRTPESEDSFVRDNPYLWGVPILFPPNRISGAAFTFEGRRYVFPMNEPKIGNFLHGAIHETPMEVLRAEKDRALFRFRADAEKPYLTFPHAFTMHVYFALKADGLIQQVRIRNDSSRNMPVALGFHTTFRIPFVRGGKAEDVRLRLTAGKEILRDMDTFLPTGEIRNDYPQRDELLGGGFIPCRNTVSRHFEMTHPAEMVLTDLASGVRVTYLPGREYRYWMVFNGGAKDFLCVEPQTWVNNCPNAPFPREETGFRVLGPGQEAVFETALRIEGAENSASLRSVKREE